MNFTKSLLLFSVVNFLVLFLLSQVPGSYLVFGNVVSHPIWALIKTAVLVAIAVGLVGKVSEVYKLKYSENVGLLVYLVVNVGALYLLARTTVSEIVGVGIKAFWVAIVAGIILNGVQYAAWKVFVEKKRR